MALEVWVTHSDDDGVTWSAARLLPRLVEGSPSGPDCNRTMAYFGLKDVKSFLQWAEELGWTRKGSDPYLFLTTFWGMPTPNAEG